MFYKQVVWQFDYNRDSKWNNNGKRFESMASRPPSTATGDYIRSVSQITFRVLSEDCHGTHIKPTGLILMSDDWSRQSIKSPNPVDENLNLITTNRLFFQQSIHPAAQYDVIQRTTTTSLIMWFTVLKHPWFSLSHDMKTKASQWCQVTCCVMSIFIDLMLQRLLGQ